MLACYLLFGLDIEDSSISLKFCQRRRYCGKAGLVLGLSLGRERRGLLHVCFSSKRSLAMLVIPILRNQDSKSFSPAMSFPYGQQISSTLYLSETIFLSRLVLQVKT